MKKLFREFGRQSRILAFGRSSKRTSTFRTTRNCGAKRQYNQAQRWAKRNGFKK